MFEAKNKELSEKIESVDKLKQKYLEAIKQMERNEFTEVVTKKSVHKTKKSTQQYQQHANQRGKDFYLNNQG